MAMAGAESADRALSRGRRSMNPGLRSPKRERRSASSGLTLARLALMLAVAGLATLTLLASGCRPASQVEGRRYVHNGLQFSFDVPDGWLVRPMAGSLAMEMVSPPRDQRRQAVVHVFGRTENQDIDLAADVQQLVKAMAGEMRFQLGDEKSAAAVEDTLAGRPARKVTRIVHEGPLAIEQEVCLVAKGRRVWALLLSVPLDDKAAYQPALDEVRKSFKVW